MSNTIFSDILGIILDYDGTVDIRGDRWSKVMLDAFRSIGVEISLPALRQTAEAVGTYLITDDVIQPTDNFSAMMRKCASLMLQNLYQNYSIDQRFVDTPDSAAAIADYCLDYMNAGFELDRNVISRLADRFPLALVSRYYPNFSAMLDEFGLTRYFKAIIQSCSLGTDADDTDIIKRGSEALGLPCRRVLVVGQSLTSDIAPALSLGCKAVWIAGKNRWNEAPAGVGLAGSLRDLPNLLQ
ncbi:MAG: HAD hydrolase-like protein [Muribaculaceae bacterium]|nr:HAD hydrolase-like protein [Muribaculaceae bacterium]